MMGGSCSVQRRRYHHGPHHNNVTSTRGGNRRGGGSGTRGDGSGRTGGCSFSSRRRRFRSRSYSSRIGHLCGGSQDSSDDESQVSEKGPTKRAVRHSVDAEVPNKSISNFYPTDDNYLPDPTDPTLRCPKSLTDLCIDTICRNLTHLDGELPPGLPQEIVDRIVRSLTSHSALNSTTLKALGKCELSTLSLANCRGVSDDWLIPLSSSSVSSGSPVSKSMIRGGSGVKQRPRSASATLKSNGQYVDLSAKGGSRSAPSSPPLRSIHHPTPFVLSPNHSSSFLEVGGSSSMMDLDDYEDSDPGDYSSNCHSPLLLPPALQNEQQGQNIDSMDTKSFASCSTSSFVSASSTPYPPAQDDAEDRPTSPLLPSVLPPPEFFSMKMPSATSSLWLYPMRGGVDSSVNNSFMSMTPSLPQKQAAPNVSSFYSAGDGQFGSAASYDNYDAGYDNPYLDAFPSNGATSTITLLDLRGSQRLTDRGLLQLASTPLSSLEIAKLDNCHGITGKGLLVFSRSHKLHTLSLANCRRLTDEAVVNVSHLGMSLMAVNLGGCRCLTDRSLEALSGLIELRKLDLSQCDLITDDGLANLHGLELIEELSLGWCRQISDEGLSILSEQPNRANALRVLHLARCPITDRGLEYLGELENLEELDLNGCIKISSSALGNTLGKLTKLTSLDVSYCPGIIRSPWQGKINALKSLELCYSGVRDSHISRLRSLPMLEELNLDSCPVGDWAIAHLADNNVMPNLTSLDLADTDITDAGMEKISNFQNITKLSLFYCNVSNAGLRYLSSMKKLEVLNLDSREIGDDGLRYLRGLPLKCLDVFSGRVTDIGCAHLSKIKTLTSLELCGGGVGDLGCAHLATLPNLTSLNLSQNERITNRGAACLAALTNLKALNLSNTCVNSEALKFLSGLLKLQSLAMYGCKDLEDSPKLNSLQSELPSLRCIRLNSANDEDGVIDHADTEEDDVSENELDDGEDDADMADQTRLLGGDSYDYHEMDSEENSVDDDDVEQEMSDIDDFEDAHSGEIESVESDGQSQAAFDGSSVEEN